MLRCFCWSWYSLCVAPPALHTKSINYQNALEYAHKYTSRLKILDNLHILLCRGGFYPITIINFYNNIASDHNEVTWFSKYKTTERNYERCSFWKVIRYSGCQHWVDVFLHLKILFYWNWWLLCCSILCKNWTKILQKNCTTKNDQNTIIIKFNILTKSIISFHPTLDDIWLYHHITYNIQFYFIYLCKNCDTL